MVLWLFLWFFRLLIVALKSFFFFFFFFFQMARNSFMPKTIMHYIWLKCLWRYNNMIKNWLVYHLCYIENILSFKDLSPKLEEIIWFSFKNLGLVLGMTKKIAQNMTIRFQKHLMSKVLQLTHSCPILSLYTPWKYQKIKGFLVFSGSMKWEHWPEMG